MKIKNLVAILLTLALAFLGASCKAKEQKTIEYPAEVFGEVVESQPISVVSLSPALTEICYDLGFEMTLDGVSDFCTLKDEKDALSLGTAQNPDIKKLVSLKPQAVILSQPLAERDLKALLEADIDTYIFDTPKTKDELWHLYDQMGELFSGKAQGVKRARERYLPYKEKLQSISPILEGKTVALIPDKDIILKNKDGLIGIFIDALGGKIAVDEKALATAEVIIAGEKEKEENILQKEELKASPATKDKAILRLDFDTILRGGFDAIDDIEKFAKENAPKKEIEQ